MEKHHLKKPNKWGGVLAFFFLNGKKKQPHIFHRKKSTNTPQRLFGTSHWDLQVGWVEAKFLQPKEQNTHHSVDGNQKSGIHEWWC